jgi:cytochrome b561
MPLLGWVIVSASPLGIPTLIFGKLVIPHISFVVNSPGKQMIGSVASWAHWALAWAASIAVGGHIAAALLHHIVEKDAILKRMLPARAHFQSEPPA